MKQKSAFAESRPEMFRDCLRFTTDELAATIRPVGKSGHNVYIGGANRKRFRALAREQARHEMRQARGE